MEIIPINGLPPIVINGFEQIRAELDAQHNNTNEYSGDIKAGKDSVKYRNQNALPDDKKDEKKVREDSKKQISFNDLADKLVRMIGNENIAIEFAMDKDSEKMVLKILDSKTNEVLQQFPPEISLKIARMVTENGQITNAKI